MGLVVVNAGHFTTVQDRGRPGYRAWGIPAGGSFDTWAAELANGLLGNSADCATLEMTLFGGTYEATAPLALAVAGAPMTVALAAPGQPPRGIAVPSSFSIGAGEQLRVGGTPHGVRTYLAVKGGWLTPESLGSRSAEAPLRVGMVLPAAPGHTPGRSLAEGFWASTERPPIRVVDGPDRVPEDLLAAWLESRFRVGRDSNRLGLRLEGVPLQWATDPARLSSPVAPGAIQLAGTQALILGAACGTMGGYPHFAHVVSADLDRIGQLRPGETLSFQRISLGEARRLDRVERARRGDRLQLLQSLVEGDLRSAPGD